jgi:hypothetical protein
MGMPVNVAIVTSAARYQLKASVDAQASAVPDSEKNTDKPGANKIPWEQEDALAY